MIDGQQEIPVKQLNKVKLKDKIGRDRLVLDMNKVFGFLPEVLIIDKVHGESSTIVISALIPKKKEK